MQNQSIEPTGGSRFCLLVFVSQRRLPPVAHARRSATGRVIITGSTGQS